MKTLLIRAEDKNRWERRAPIVPRDLAEILDVTRAQARVETSAKRFFDEKDYTDAGATVCQGMADGDVIFGVKEIPIEKILDGKAYLFFSHTIKGQADNMPLLRRIMASGSTLIDYEKITDEKDRRLIYFGPFAGDAGAIDILSLMGETWAAKGIDTPFATFRRAHQYDSVADARQHLSQIGQQIETHGLPAALCPFTVGILGYGNVSKGAQQIFDCLPTERVPADGVLDFIRQGKGDRHKVYVTVFEEKDLVRPIADGEAFDLQTYYRQPERFAGNFEQYLPAFTLLVNAVYWEARYPRFVTWAGLRRLAENHSPIKLQGIADITCDTHGSVECNVKSTDSDMPAYRVDPMAGTTSDGHIGEGIVLLAVDNLPCELPSDSSTFFSNQLKPFVPALIAADFSVPLAASGLPPELAKAVIVYNGKLTDRFAYLEKFLNG